MNNAARMLSGRWLGAFLTATAFALVAGALNAASAAAYLPQPAVSATAHCSDSTIGELPCTWTAGVNVYPGDSDSFSKKSTDPIVRKLVARSKFDTVSIIVPISASNFTDAHVQMPRAGHYEEYACVRHGTSGPAQSYYSPSAAQVTGIARTVLHANPHAIVVIRPILALGGSCDPADYYPTGQYFGTDFRHTSNVKAFEHFYTAIIKRLANDAQRIGYTSHVVLDDASEMSCLFDDPDNVGYRSYFAQLPQVIGEEHPALPQMYTLAWNFAASSDASCGWSGSISKPQTFDETSRDRAALQGVGLLGIDEQFPLAKRSWPPLDTAAELYERWQRATEFAAGRKRSADELVRYLHARTGHEIVLSAIAYSDCTLSPGYRPSHIPPGCNRQLSAKKQQTPPRAEIVAERAADQAAYCYWTQSEGSSDPWFLGIWWWNRDFDSHPYVDPYDLTWGQAQYGISALGMIHNWLSGSGSCAGVGGVSVTNPGPQSATIGFELTLDISADDLAPGGTLHYSASNLPGGLSIWPTTGVISGKPTELATNRPVTVTVTDSHGGPSASTTFDLTVSPEP